MFWNSELVLKMCVVQRVGISIELCSFIVPFKYGFNLNLQKSKWYSPFCGSILFTNYIDYCDAVVRLNPPMDFFIRSLIMHLQLCICSICLFVFSTPLALIRNWFKFHINCWFCLQIILMRILWTICRNFWLFFSLLGYINDRSLILCSFFSVFIRLSIFICYDEK